MFKPSNAAGAYGRRLAVLALWAPLCALAGVTIPLHDGAADYFAAARAPAVESPAAATQ